jgi:mRNA interferase MazF
VGRFVKGDVVAVPFPFSDLAQAKRRPALVLAELEGDDRILCQITSRGIRDRYAVELDDNDAPCAMPHAPYSTLYAREGGSCEPEDNGSG